MAIADRPSRAAGGAVSWMLAAALLIGVLTYVMWTMGDSPAAAHTFRHAFGPVLGRPCLIAAVARADRKELVRKALLQAERAIRDAEAMLDPNCGRSEVAALNAADVGHRFALSPQMQEILAAAQAVGAQSGGAFDVTAGPLKRLWQRTAAGGGIPTDDELQEARAQSNWQVMELQDDGVVRRSPTGCMDLSSVAPGYLADRGREALVLAGVGGGAVQIGGAWRCFGRQEGGQAWEVDIPDPFHPASGRLLGTLMLGEAAASIRTRWAGGSGDLIVDPVLLTPADPPASVVVVAPTAVAAEAWAEVLSVLGSKGLERIDPHLPIEAMVVAGSADNPSRYMTRSFAWLLVNK